MTMKVEVLIKDWTDNNNRDHIKRVHCKRSIILLAQHLTTCKIKLNKYDTVILIFMYEQKLLNFK
jgi:hypothetical protein